METEGNDKAARFTRDDEGRWIAKDEAGAVVEAWVPWEPEVRFTLKAANLFANMRTEGWINDALKEKFGFRDYREMDDPFVYAISGPLDLGAYGARLGLITVEKAEHYTGKISLYVHVGEPDESKITHFKGSDKEHPRQEPEVFVSIYTSVERARWLRDEITRRPGDTLHVTVKARLYANLHNLSQYTGTFCLEYDNLIRDEKRCAIIGADFELVHNGELPPVEQEEPEELPPPPAPRPSFNDLLTAKIATSLQWVVALLGLLTLIVLLKGCKL